MTVAVIALAALAAGLTATLVYFAVDNRRLVGAVREARSDEFVAQRRADDAEQLTINTARELKTALERIAVLTKRLEAAELLATTAAEESRKHVETNVRSGDAGNAARVVNDLLSAPLPGAADTGAGET